MGFGIGVHKEISASMTALKCETSLDATQLSALKGVKRQGQLGMGRPGDRGNYPKGLQTTVKLEMLVISLIYPA